MNPQKQQDTAGPGETTDARRDETSVAEWLVAALGLVLVIGAVAFLLYQVLAVETKPPDIVLRAGETVKNQQGYLVMITVRNEGGRTVAGLTVEGSLNDGGEVSEVTIDYVPPHSEREAGLFFNEDPRTSGLSLRATGYQDP